MTKGEFTTARIVFHVIVIGGWILFILAPIWVGIVRIFGSAFFGADGTGMGIAFTFLHAFFALCLVAGGQLGLAQLAVANNTAAMLDLMKAQNNGATPQTERSRPEPRISRL